MLGSLHIRAEQFLCENLDSIVALVAVSFKVVIMPLFIHCLSLLPLGVFVLVPCFEVWFLVSSLFLQLSS